VRIWYQSFVDPDLNRPYLERLSTYLNGIAGAGTEVTVAGLSPPDRFFSRLTELRCAVLAVDNAIESEEQGYDAFVLGHFQDPGLYEARSACRIPVVGLGEASLCWAARLGGRLALVTIDEVFVSWHWEQVARYGLRDRVMGVTALDARVEDFAPAFAGDVDAARSLIARFRERAQPLVDAGADVVIPAGGLFGLLVAQQTDLAVGDAPVLNCVAVALKSAVMAVQLRELEGLDHARRGPFAAAPPEAIAEFRAFVAAARRGLGMVE
jgi:allantoin racemase